MGLEPLVVGLRAIDADAAVGADLECEFGAARMACERFTDRVERPGSEHEDCGMIDVVGAASRQREGLERVVVGIRAPVGIQRGRGRRRTGAEQRQRGEVQSHSGLPA
jgi:hypothetical protein